MLWMVVYFRSGACCNTKLDSSGVCCQSGMVDACGVCDGLSTSCATQVSMEVTPPGDLNPLSPEYAAYTQSLIKQFAALMGISSDVIEVCGTVVL